MSSKYPRLSKAAHAILAACGDVPLTTKVIAAKSGQGGKSGNLTAVIGATDPKVRAKWQGESMSQAYHALPKPVAGQDCSLAGLGYVELGKSGRQTTLKITTEGKAALKANDKMAEMEREAAKSDDKSAS